MPDKRTLGICLGNGPDHRNAEFAYRLAVAATNKQIAVRVFLFADGIYNAISSKSIKNSLRPFQELTKKGIEISTCTEMAKVRGVTTDNAAAEIEFVSLIMFADMVRTCDRILLLHN